MRRKSDGVVIARIYIITLIAITVGVLVVVVFMAGNKVAKNNSGTPVAVASTSAPESTASAAMAVPDRYYRCVAAGKPRKICFQVAEKYGETLDSSDRTISKFTAASYEGNGPPPTLEPTLKPEPAATPEPTPTPAPAPTPLKTKAQLPMAANGLPGAQNEVPSFATLEALDEYYDAADSGNCDDNCLASLWLKLGNEEKVTLLDDGMTVWVLRRQADPTTRQYHDCRLLYYSPAGDAINSWVLCANINGAGI
jgi:hypothetical protein